MKTMLERWAKVENSPHTTYSPDLQVKGVPSPVIWRNRELWWADRIHCSGAVWWALVEMLKKIHGSARRCRDGQQNDRGVAPAVWEDPDPDKRGDLPILLGELGLADYSNEPPQEGDICQVWRTNGTGHLIVCAGWEDGKMLEWSASNTTPTARARVTSSGTPEQYFTARLKEGFSDRET